MSGFTDTRRAVAMLGAGSLIALTIWWLGRGTVSSTRERPVDTYPALFGIAPACLSQARSLEHARRLEELGLLRADRYPYDPRDGIHAVELYQQAESCYRAAGALLDATRVHAAVIDLSSRVQTDYAAARLSLSKALKAERWSVALEEVRRLLLLTEHVAKHDYVEWLKKIVGRLTARARKSS
jgi:hypothetical protein